MEIHHIGYLIKRMERALPSFEALGFTVTVPPTWDDTRKVQIAFLENGAYRAELIEPAPESPIYPLLKQYENAPYHLCYRCEDIDAAAAQLREQKFMLFQETAPAPVIGEYARVAFLYSARAGMIELLEEKE